MSPLSITISTFSFLAFSDNFLAAERLAKKHQVEYVITHDPPSRSNFRIGFDLGKALSEKEVNLLFSTLAENLDEFRESRRERAFEASVKVVSLLRRRHLPLLLKLFWKNRQELARAFAAIALQKFPTRKVERILADTVKTNEFTTSLSSTRQSKVSLKSIGEKRLKQNPKPKPHHAAFVYTLASPTEHPKTFTKLFFSLKRKQFTGQSEKWWQTYAKQLKDREKKLK